MDVSSWTGMADDAAFVNALLQQALEAVKEVMGENGLDIVLKEAGLERYIGNPPPNNLEAGSLAKEYANLNEAIQEFYGRAGMGMLRRIGKASFQWAVREQAALLGIAGVALKVMPRKTRAKFILTNIGKALMDTNPAALVVVEDANGGFTYTDYGCAICHTRTSDRPICYLYLGSLEEALLWATVAAANVDEVACKAVGAEYCRFQVTLD